MGKLKNSDIAKQQAISTTSGLIVTAFGLAFIIVLGVPQLFGVILTNPTPEPTKTIFTVLTGVFTSVTFLWFSSDRIKSKVSAAIEHSAAEKFKSYKKENSSQALIDTQNREFLGILCFLSGTPSAREQREYNNDRENVLARQTILRNLSGKDQFLEEIGQAACLKVFKKQNASYSEIESDPQLHKFWQDICLYLKAWLIISIGNGRPMSTSAIRQRYPDQDSPNKWIYLDALTFIKDKLIEHAKTRKQLGEENQELAIKMIKVFLSRESNTQ
jgi:hypothetical protein